MIKSRDFVDAVERIRSKGLEKNAVVIDLVKLPLEFRGAAFSRIAYFLVDECALKYQAQVFDLRPNYIVVLLDHADEDALRGIRFVFEELGAHTAADKIISQHDVLSRDLQFETVLKHSAAHNLLPIEEPVEKKRPITLQELAELEATLKQCSLGSFLRSQNIFAASKDAAPVPVFHERFVSITELAGQIGPNVDIQACSHLFQHFTRILDKKVLEHISKNDEQLGQGRFSVNLNLGTILSPVFAQFDKNIVASARKSILIEVNISDILTSPKDFSIASRFLNSRGFKIAVDGLTPELLPTLRTLKAWYHFLKLNSDSFENSNVDIDCLKKDLEAVKYGALILTRCDTKEKLALGRKIGATLFQGYFLDSVYRSYSKRNVKAKKCA